jgi:hypothetical protein
VLVDSIDALAPGIVLYHLPPGLTVLGHANSDPAPDIALTADGLASSHCTIECESETVRLLPGEGRTLVDDAQVDEALELHQGQIVNLNDCYLFKFINPAEVGPAGSACLRDRVWVTRLCHHEVHAHTHTHIRTRTRTHTHAHTSARTHAYIEAQTHRRTLTVRRQAGSSSCVTAVSSLPRPCAQRCGACAVSVLSHEKPHPHTHLFS